MTHQLTPSAMTAWGAKDLPARLLAEQVAKLLNCTKVDVGLLVAAGHLQPLGQPNPNSVKFFSAVELIELLADREWLDAATRTIGQFWKRKNARRGRSRGVKVPGTENELVQLPCTGWIGPSANGHGRKKPQ